MGNYTFFGGEQPNINLATVVFTLSEDMTPVITKVVGFLAEREVIAMFREIEKKYSSTVLPSWREAVINIISNPTGTDITYNFHDVHSN